MNIGAFYIAGDDAFAKAENLGSSGKSKMTNLTAKMTSCHYFGDGTNIDFRKPNKNLKTKIKTIYNE